MVGVEPLELGVKRLRERTALNSLAMLFGVSGVVHLETAPVVLSEYWLLQELHSGFASTHLEVEMLFVPSLLIFGVLLLVTSLLVWRRRRGRLFGAFLAFFSVLLNLLVIASMRLSWISVVFSVAGILLNLLALVTLFALKRSGVKGKES